MHTCPSHCSSRATRSRSPAPGQGLLGSAAHPLQGAPRTPSREGPSKAVTRPRPFTDPRAPSLGLPGPAPTAAAPESRGSAVSNAETPPRQSPTPGVAPGTEEGRGPQATRPLGGPRKSRFDFRLVDPPSPAQPSVAALDRGRTSDSVDPYLTPARCQEPPGAPRSESVRATNQGGNYLKKDKRL